MEEKLNVMIWADRKKSGTMESLSVKPKGSEKFECVLESRCNGKGSVSVSEITRETSGKILESLRKNVIIRLPEQLQSGEGTSYSIMIKTSGSFLFYERTAAASDAEPDPVKQIKELLNSVRNN